MTYSQVFSWQHLAASLPGLLPKVYRRCHSCLCIIYRGCHSCLCIIYRRRHSCLCSIQLAKITNFTKPFLRNKSFVFCKLSPQDPHLFAAKISILNDPPYTEVLIVMMQKRLDKTWKTTIEYFDKCTVHAL